MSAQLAIATPRRIKASHRRRWKITAGHFVYQHTDALGSPVAVTDASKAVTERTQYTPYGAPFNHPVEGIGYTGHVMDQATGLAYAQQRYFDPQLGRFLSVDPMASDTNTGWNFNRYAYANNNPYKFTDPDGRQPCSDACMKQRATSDDSMGLSGGFGVGSNATAGQTETVKEPPTFANPSQSFDTAKEAATAGQAQKSEMEDSDGIMDALFGGSSLVMLKQTEAGQYSYYFAKPVTGMPPMLGFRTTATTLAEKLAMAEVKAGGRGTADKFREIMQGKINDPRYPAGVFRKMEYIRGDINTGKNIIIHFWEKITDGVRSGAKFKDY